MRPILLKCFRGIFHFFSYIMRINHVELTAQFANTMQEQKYTKHTKSSFREDALRNVICDMYMSQISVALCMVKLLNWCVGKLPNWNAVWTGNHSWWIKSGMSITGRYNLYPLSNQVPMPRTQTKPGSILCGHPDTRTDKNIKGYSIPQPYVHEWFFLIEAVYKLYLTMRAANTVTGAYIRNGFYFGICVAYIAYICVSVCSLITIGSSVPLYVMFSLMAWNVITWLETILWWLSARLQYLQCVIDISNNESICCYLKQAVGQTALVFVMWFGALWWLCKVV